MTAPWTQADLTQLEKMVKQKASASDIARSLGRRVGSVKTKVREMGLVPLKKPRFRSNPPPCRAGAEGEGKIK